jgi:methyltransferase
VQGGYDLTVGTSERGTVQPAHELRLPRGFRHLLVAFGGPSGLEECTACDRNAGGADPSTLFDLYVNTCPRQGSRTIRTEEAMLISMAYLQPAIEKASCQP